jgi:hypothetical protein
VAFAETFVVVHDHDQVNSPLNAERASNSGAAVALQNHFQFDSKPKSEEIQSD